VLVGVNLLREGLDLPEVSLVAVLDADKEGYLRSATALIQTIGRAARHLEGTALLYADKMTEALRRAIEETQRRRARQLEYNQEHGITPQSIVKNIDEVLGSVCEADYVTVPAGEEDEPLSLEELAEEVKRLEKEMFEAASQLEFERAAELRDRVQTLREKEKRLVTAE
jgi:excinuclease ABC subunit B